jgi:phage-related tail protein
VFGPKAAGTFMNVTSTANDLLGAALKLQPAVSAIFKYFVETIVPKLAEFTAGVGPTIKQIFEDIDDIALKLLPALETVTSFLADTAIGAFTDFLNIVAGITGALRDLANFNWSGLAEKIGGLLPDLSSLVNLMNTFSNPVGAIGSFFSNSFLNSNAFKDPSKTQTTNTPVTNPYGNEPGYATGTDYASKGWHMVGEQGPELMYFKGGEKVLNNTETSGMMGNQTIYITVQSDSLQKVTDVVKLFEGLRQMQRAY